MSALKILSGGAAQGLVTKLAPRFKMLTGLDLEGEFGAVGAMADQMRNGSPADMVILTASIIAELALERLVIAGSVADIGRVETALAVRTGDPLVTVDDAAGLRAAWCAADAIFVPDTKTSTAGIHVAKLLRQLGIAEHVAPRLKIFPNGATAMRALASTEAARPIGCTQATEIMATAGVMLLGTLPPGCALSTMYTAAVTRQAARSREAQSIIDFLTGSDQDNERRGAGFLTAR